MLASVCSDEATDDLRRRSTLCFLALYFPERLCLLNRSHCLRPDRRELSAMAPPMTRLLFRRRWTWAQGGIRFGKGVFRNHQADRNRSGEARLHIDQWRRPHDDRDGRPRPCVSNHRAPWRTADPWTVKDVVWDRERAPQVTGLEIVGRHAEADGIELDGTMQAIVSRVTVREAQHGIHLVNRNRNVIISGCHLYDNRGAGVFLDRVNLHQFLIGDSHVSYNKHGGVVVLGGNVRNIHIGNCDLEANMPKDDVPSTAANILVDLTHAEGDASATARTDTVAEITVTGCTIQHTGKNTSSANVRLIGRDDYPINTASISANVMSDASRNIDMAYVSGIAMAGNVFFNAPIDVHVENGRRMTLTGNQFDPREYEAARDKEGGLKLVDCEDVVLTGLQMSEITSTHPAIDLERCQRVTLTSSQLRNCVRGILVRSCSDCLVSNNLISGVHERGTEIVAEESTNVRLSGNLVIESAE